MNLPASGLGVPQRPLLGVGLILLMVSCFATLDTTAKVLGTLLPAIVGLFARYLAQAVIMGVWLGVRWLRGGGNLFRTEHPRFQILRGMLLLSCSALLFFGIRYMPVGEFTAIGMLTPVLVTVLAALFLHEHLSVLRAVLVAGGFIGALVVTRPGSGLFGWVALLPLAMAMTYAAFQLLTRQLSSLDHPYTTHFYTGFVGAAVTAVVVAAWEPARSLDALRHAAPSTWALLLLAGVGGTAGHLFLILALRVAPISVLMPFTYLQLVAASIGGWIAFQHVPDGWAFVGMAIVASCGAASVWLNLRESQTAKRIPPSELAPAAD